MITKMKTCLFLWIVTATVTFGQTPCQNFITIKEPHRSAQFQLATGDAYLCDSKLQAGWYKFNGGEQMPTSCVPTDHCGTQSPIWFKGQHPTQKNVAVKGTGCINLGNNVLFGPPCCHDTVDISVMNCGLFFIYYLGRTPGCEMAYCAGNGSVCGIGEYKGPNNTCIKLYPHMIGFPKLKLPETVSGGHVRFPCIVPYNKTGVKDVAFEVGWTIDDVTIKDPRNGKPVETILTGDNRTAYLNADFLYSHLGKTLKCTVRSYNLSAPLLKSNIRPSAGYFVGMNVSKSVVIVDEKGPEQEITLESTIPIPCHNNNPTQCKLSVELKASNNPNDISTSSCIYDLKYDPITGKYKTTIKIKATRDFVKDKDNVHELAFRPVSSTSQPLWTHYKPPTVQIETKDQDSGSCAASADPHFIGLDNKKNYNVYQIGEFTMYKSKGRNFEVQVRNWACGGRYHPCICAVVAREGNDVIQIDICSKRKNQPVAPQFKILSKSPLDGTSISRDPTGKNFYINFPSGTRVKVSAFATGRGYLNVNIQAPSDDLGKTEGLCGTFDHNPNNDFQGPDGHIYHGHQNQPDQFVASWALKPNQSLFDKVPVYNPALKHQHQYCQCNHHIAVCGKTAAKNPSKNLCFKKCIPIGQGNANGRRSIYDFDYNDDDHDEDIPFDVTYETRIIEHKRAVSPTPSGITRETAQKTCSDALQKSTLYHHCESNHDILIPSYIDSCVEDILAADSDDFVLGALMGFDDNCADVIMTNTSNYVTGTNAMPMLPEILTHLYCPNNCNMRGECINGTCRCHHGFTSSDCSVQLGVASEILRIRGDSLCDVRRHPCEQASLIVSNIMDTPLLRCKYRRVELAESERLEYNNYTTVVAEFKNFMEVACPLPQPLISTGIPVHGYLISVSTDNITYSAEKMFVVYDGKCQQCNESGNCTMKNDTCLIDGMCRQIGETNDEMQICEPSLNTTTWSNNTYIQEINQNTVWYTGCTCSGGNYNFDCACCSEGACPCPSPRQHQCTSCKNPNCENYPIAFRPSWRPSDPPIHANSIN